MTEHGEGFSVSRSFGAVLLPEEADDVSHALSLADERLYAEKHARRAVVDRSTHAFLEALAERDPQGRARAAQDVTGSRAGALTQPVGSCPSGPGPTLRP